MKLQLDQLLRSHLAFALVTHIDHTFCPPASTTCTYPCLSFASPLGISRLPYLTLWTTFCALLGWQSGNLSVFGLHNHSPSLHSASWHSETMDPMFLGCALNVFQVHWMDVNACIHLGESIPPSHGLPSPDIMADWNTT
jgi:hypothetical protein